MLTYFNAPIWIYPPNITNQIVQTGDSGSGIWRASFWKVDSTSLTINYANSLQPSKGHGQSGSYDQLHDGPLKGTISYEAYYAFTGQGQLDYYSSTLHIGDLTGNNLDGSGEVTVRIGNLEFKKCYMTNYRVTADPSEGVVKYNADFDFYSGATGKLSEDTYEGFYTDSYDGSFDSLTAGIRSPYLAAAHTMKINGNELNQTMSVDYSVSCPRIASYRLGDEIPSSVKLQKCEKSVKIKGSLTNFINYSGRSAYVNVSGKPFVDQSGTFSYQHMFNITGEIVNQNMSAQYGGIMDGNVEIREVIV